MAITTRDAKGAALTWAELDENFTDLRDGVNIMVPKTQNSGIKVDSLGTPTYPWHDIIGHLFVDYKTLITQLMLPIVAVLKPISLLPTYPMLMLTFISHMIMSSVRPSIYIFTGHIMQQQ